MNKPNNFAYIDGNNLYRGLGNCGWKIDFGRFRKWLSDKYGVTKAYYFIGMVPSEKYLYTALQRAGFLLIFKEVIFNGLGVPKGNCDADLVLQSVIDVYENQCDRQIIVTSDGDYACLVSFLREKEKFEALLSPSAPSRCSILLKRLNVCTVYLDETGLKEKLRLKEKAPSKDETLKGSFS